MSFDQLYKRSISPNLSLAERKESCILVIDQEISVRHVLRQLLSSLGYANHTDASDHAMGLQKLKERHVTHVMFDARKTNLTAKEFLYKALEHDENLIAMPTSYEPTLDDIFDLLVAGARGYIVKPCNERDLDEAVVMATKGEPISESILHAKNRNEALAGFILSTFDRVALNMRHATTFATAKGDLSKSAMAFKQAITIGKTFAKGGLTQLLDSIVELSIQRGEGPASRLGKARRRLGNRKAKVAKSPAANTAQS